MIVETTNPTIKAPELSRKRRGFTLTEIAIVLGIIGLILGSIWVAAAAVYNNLRVSKTNTEVLQIAQGIRSLYSTSSSTANLTVDQLVCAKVIPGDLVLSVCGTPATLGAQWGGGATTIIPTSDNNGFEISLSNIPRGACDSILMEVAGQTRDAGLFLAQGGQAAAPAAVATGSPLTVTATPALADAAVANGFGGCKTTDPGVVTFGFSLH